MFQKKEFQPKFQTRMALLGRRDKRSHLLVGAWTRDGGPNGGWILASPRQAKMHLKNKITNGSLGPKHAKSGVDHTPHWLTRLVGAAGPLCRIAQLARSGQGAGPKSRSCHPLSVRAVVS